MYANKFHVSISIWSIYQRTKSNNNDAQNTSKYPKGIIQFAIDLGVSAHVRKNFPRLCIYANNPALEDFVIQNHYKEFLRTYAINFHVSIKKLRICENNLALEDFVIQNRYKEFLRTYAKNFHVSIKDLRICRNSFRSIAICIILFKDTKFFAQTIQS